MGHQNPRFGEVSVRNVDALYVQALDPLVPTDLDDLQDALVVIGLLRRRQLAIVRGDL